MSIRSAIEPHGLSDRPARGKRVLAERAAQPRELLAKRAVRLFARPVQMSSARRSRASAKPSARPRQARIAIDWRPGSATRAPSIRRNSKGPSRRSCINKGANLHHGAMRGRKDSSTRLKPRVNSPSIEPRTSPPTQSDAFSRAFHEPRLLLRGSFPPRRVSGRCGIAAADGRFFPIPSSRKIA